MEPTQNFEKPREKNIFKQLRRVQARSREWFVGFAQKKHAERWLAFFSFAESSFFPIPPDFLLAPILLVNAARWFYLALLTTISSVLGGIAGYFIGTFFFEVVGKPLIEIYHFEEEVAKVGVLFSENAFLSIFAAAFTPIPYKVFTIAAGFFSINFLIFILASFLGRGLRFFMVAYVIKRYGGHITAFAIRYINTFSLLMVALIVIVLLLLSR